MTAELVAHRGQQLVREVGLAAGAEALVQRRAQDGRRDGFVDRGGKRPPSFAGVRDAAFEAGEIGILGERGRGQVEEPRGSVIADRKSTRLNSSHGYISYAVFCLKKKKKPQKS